MNHSILKTASFSYSFGWGRFSVSGFFGVE